MEKFSEFWKLLTYRHQPSTTLYRAIKGGLKGIVTIEILAFMSSWEVVPFLIAPFGASCILLYTTPEDEYAQPLNVIGGYFISTLLSIVLLEYFPEQWWTIAIILGISIAVMAMLRVTHPPAGALPILIALSPEIESYWFLLTPIVSGSVLLVIIAWLVHKIPPGREYPKKIPR